MEITLWTYRAEFFAKVDGDTVKVILDHGMYMRSVQSIRLADVLAPELDEPLGKEAREELSRQLLVQHSHGNGWPFLVSTKKDTRSFNRYIGVIHCASCGANINEAMNQWLRAKGLLARR